MLTTIDVKVPEALTLALDKAYRNLGVRFDLAEFVSYAVNGKVTEMVGYIPGQNVEVIANGPAAELVSDR